MAEEGKSLAIYYGGRWSIPHETDVAGTDEMMAVLELIPGGATVAVAGEGFTIGSDPRCDLCLADPLVSPEHCRLSVSGREIILVDSGSEHGTFAKGSRVLMMRLRDGNEFLVGSTCLRVRLADPPTARKDRAFTIAWALGGLGAVLFGTFLVLSPLLRQYSFAGPHFNRPTEAVGPVVISDPELKGNVEPLPIVRTERLASSRIAATKGGVVKASELTITVPTGSFDRDRKVIVSRIEPLPCPFEIAAVGSTETRTPVVLGSWEVDVGDSTDLFPGSVEVEIDLGRLGAAEADLLIPAISFDHKTWTRLPYERRGDSVFFTSRHFSVVSLWGLLEAVGLVLPIVMVAYVEYDKPNEIPENFHKYAPFVRLATDREPSGFEIWWSAKLPGLDPKTGYLSFDNDATYREWVAIARSLMVKWGLDETDIQKWPAEAKKEGLEAWAEFWERTIVPRRVRVIRDALEFARDYLATRGIDPPFFNLLVYIVPEIGDNTAFLHNPWTGRQYMIIKVDATVDELYTTALHELFHHYQSGFVWYERTAYLPFMEASALLMEREAADYYAARGRPFALGNGLDVAQVISYAHGLTGPKVWDEDPVRRFGYGLTWFLEHLRDGWAGGNRPEFHLRLLEQWQANKIDAAWKTLQWAAGGSMDGLKRSWLEFARAGVLEGLELNQGSGSRYGRLYSRPVFLDSAYQATVVVNEATPLEQVYGLSPTVFDTGKTPIFEINDAMIRPWSINYYKVIAPPRADAQLLVRVPRAWEGDQGPRRQAYVRAGAAEQHVTPIQDVDRAPLTARESVAVVDFKKDAFVYVVDAFKEVGNYDILDSAELFLLEPPSKVLVVADQGSVTVSWTRPPAADKYSSYHLYLNGSKTRDVEEDARSTTCTFHPPSVGVDQVNLVEIVSAVEVGRDRDGEPVFVKSKPARAQDEPMSGEFLVTLSSGAATVECSPPRADGAGFSFTLREETPVTLSSAGAFTIDQDFADVIMKGNLTFTGVLQGDTLEVSGTSRFAGETGVKGNPMVGWSSFTGTCSIPQTRSKVVFSSQKGLRQLTTTGPLVVSCMTDDEGDTGAVVWYTDQPKPPDFDKPTAYHTVCKGSVELTVILRPR